MNMQHSATRPFFYMIVFLITLLPLSRLQAGTSGLSIQEETESEITGNLKVTGKGLAPANVQKGTAEARLLARRAATLDSYKNMAVLLSDVTPYLVEGAGLLITEGFIQGARVTETRYLENGWVQVDLELPVKLLPEVRGSLKTMHTFPDDTPGEAVGVVNLDKKIYEIDRTEWEELVGTLQ